MSKRFLILSLILFALCSSARAADSKPYTLQIDTSVVRDIRGGARFTFPIHAGMEDRTFQLAVDSTTDTIERIEVFVPGKREPVQTFHVPQDEPPYRDADYFKAVDIDFDGYTDIGLLMWWGATGNEGWMFWRFDPSSRLFVEAPEVSALGRPEFDDKEKVIHTHAKGGMCLFTRADYRYQKGNLTKFQEEQCTPNPDSTSNECTCKTTRFPG